MRVGATALLAATVIAGSVFSASPPATSASVGHGPVVVDLGDDIVLPEVGPPGRYPRTLAAPDPLGLVTNVDIIRRYTSGTDTFEVWACLSYGALSSSLESLVADANANITPYFEWLSDGDYHPVFVAGGTVPAGEPSCEGYINANSSGTANAAISLGNWLGGLAGPGWCSSAPCTYPGNSRFGQVGVQLSYLMVLAHEMGHMIHWPHSYTGNRIESGSVYNYDNASDVMSGNRGMTGAGCPGPPCSFGSYPLPYATPAINRYAAGWIDAADVTVHGGTTTEAVLQEIGDPGTEMLVIHGSCGYWTLNTRIPSTYDPIPSFWAGVEVMWIDQCTGGWGISRRTVPQPPIPFNDTLPEYTAPLAHVLGVGDTLTVGSYAIEVLAREGDAFRVRVISPRFLDVLIGNIFYNDIEWLADEGITQGCNPPGNTLFCPTTKVTRGQMAAFLVRAFGYTDDGGGNTFVDDDGSIFEDDIAKLAAAGITKGCNPPTNDRYCPDSKVTREQMAAFLVRALGLTDDGGGNTFVDDDGSIFEDDIAKLAAAGITKGCNPPANTMFCPTDQVSREQMAAFLHRALTP